MENMNLKCQMTKNENIPVHTSIKMSLASRWNP